MTVHLERIKKQSIYQSINDLSLKINFEFIQKISHLFSESLEALSALVGPFATPATPIGTATAAVVVAAVH